MHSCKTSAPSACWCTRWDFISTFRWRKYWQFCLFIIRYHNDVCFKTISSSFPQYLNKFCLSQNFGHLLLTFSFPTWFLNEFQKARGQNLIVSCPHLNPLIWNSSNDHRRRKSLGSGLHVSLPAVSAKLLLRFQLLPLCQNVKIFLMCFLRNGHLSVVWGTANQLGHKSSLHKPTMRPAVYTHSDWRCGWHIGPSC